MAQPGGSAAHRRGTLERGARVERARLLLPEVGALHVAARADAAKRRPTARAAVVRRVPAPQRDRRQPARALVRLRQPSARDGERTVSRGGACGDGGITPADAVGVRAPRAPGPRATAL